MTKFSLPCALCLILPGCATRLEMIVENHSEQPLDLVISTPHPRGGYPVPGDVFHAEIGPGGRWSTAAWGKERVGSAIYGDRVVVIEREHHMRSVPAPSEIQATVFAATPDDRRVTLTFMPGTDGWGYTARLKDGSIPAIEPLDYHDAARSSDGRELLELWAAWKPGQDR